jgi:hypothetical protein
MHNNFTKTRSRNQEDTHVHSSHGHHYNIEIHSTNCVEGKGVTFGCRQRRGPKPRQQGHHGVRWANRSTLPVYNKTLGIKKTYSKVLNLLSHIQA